MNVRVKIVEGCFLIAAIFAMVGHAHAHISAGNIDESYAIERVSVSQDGRVYAWDRKGEAITGWPVDFISEGLRVEATPRLVDVNRDGRLEIALILRSASGAEQLRVLRGDAAELTGWRFAFPQGAGALAGPVVIADINQDNRLELSYATAQGKAVVYRHDSGFTKLDAFNADFSAAPILVAADLDNDGRDSLYAIDAAHGEISVWEADGSRHGFASVGGNAAFSGGAASMDVDGDGRAELVVGTTAPELLAFNKDGNAVARYPLPAKPAARPMIADLDLDMEQEIIVLLADRTVYSMHADGSRVRRWDWHLPYEAGDSLDVGVVAFDLYDGLVSSISGWDSLAIYKVSRDRFSELNLGENVHDYDRVLAEMELPITQIDEVVVQPKVITPNGDGYNDDAELSYLLSSAAAVTAEVQDAAGNTLYTVAENVQQHSGPNSLRISGVNTKGTATPNDDEPLPKGLYYIRLTALNDLGLASRVTTPLIVFGVRAEIDLPKDNDKADNLHPVVYGVVDITGIATDPNIGEGNDNFDFKAYKVYFRPGSWSVDEAQAIAAGETGSSWRPVLVPIQHQSPQNSANEPADASYPLSNVSVRPIQHGLLAQWDTTDAAATPNGLYTILLKVVDGNGNTVGRVNFDSVVVDLKNVAPGTPYDPNDPSTNPNDPENIGPKLSNIQASPDKITAQAPESSISYALSNETSNINISIYKVANGQIGPVVASFAQNSLAPGSYSLSWNGKDNLGKRVDVGTYRARITAAAVDGTGGDSKTTADISMGIATEYNAGLAILNFSLSSDLFDPFNFITDGNGQQVQAEELTAAYSLNRFAKISIGVYDEYDVLVRTLASGKVDKIGSVSWNGADDQGAVVQSGKNYEIRLRAECIDAGCSDVVQDKKGVAVRALSIGGGGLAADITMLIGEGDKNGTTPDEIAGILRDDDDPLSDHPINGSSDFKWRAYGKGYIRVPFTYEISASGGELLRHHQNREAFVTPENVPLTTVSAPGYTQNNPQYCQPIDFRLDPSHTTWTTLTFDQGFGLEGYSVNSNTVPNGISVRVTTPQHNEELAAPFAVSASPDDGAGSVSIGLSLQGRPRGSGGISTADQSYLMSQCSYGADLSLCDQLDYRRTPANSWYLMACWETIPPSLERDDPTTICGLWVDGIYPHTAAPITCGGVHVLATAKKEEIISWGPFSSTGNSLLNSIDQPGATWIADYSGSTSDGNIDLASSWINDYGLTFSPYINGQPRTTSDSSGYLDVGGVVRAWLGNHTGPDAGGSLYVDILPDDFETTDDTKLSSNTCVFNGGKFINGAYDSTVQSASRRCVIGDVKDVNAQYFRLDSGPYSLYGAYPLEGHPLLYTFSDVVHVTEWTVDLRYPDRTVNDSFDMTDMLVNPNGTSDTNGDGTPESNKNVNDSFKLKLKANAAPKRLIEVRGSVSGDAWELRYFEAKTNSWQKIAEGVGASSGTLAWWDVSRLNGRQYTLMLRATDSNGTVKTEDALEVAIGTLVKANTPAVVESPYKRYSIHFDEYSLCPDGGPYPCNSSIDELITVTPIPTNTPGLYLPSGITPIGPVIEIKPDNIALNPTYQPQLEAYFMREEIEKLYEHDSQEAKDRVFGITAADPPVMAIYNLKEDGELEQIATINTWDDRGTPGTADDIFRISGMLNHFSRYVLLREDDGYPRLAISAPTDQATVRGNVRIQGSISGVDPSDEITQLNITVSSDEQGQQIIYSTPGASFDFDWSTSGKNGWQKIEAKARTRIGKEAGSAVSVYIDNKAPVTEVVVNEKLVEPGELAVVPPNSQLMLLAEDAADRSSVVNDIRYRWDNDPYQQYAGIISLANVAAGRHAFSCYAVDDQGNQEPEQLVYITIVDPNQPGSGADIATSLEIGDAHFNDGHQTWVSEATPMSISAADGSPAVHQVLYRVSDKDYQVYKAPITLEGFEEGVYKINFFGIDYYGLNEAAHEEPVVLDATPPRTVVTISEPMKHVGGEYFISSSTKVSCSADDGGLIPSGIGRIEYSLDGGPWIHYSAPFAPDDNGTGTILLSIRGVDRVENKEEPQLFKLRLDAAAPDAELISGTRIFSPNGDGVKDSAIWKIRASGGLGNTIRAALSIDGFAVNSMETASGNIELAWDGRINGQKANDGEHAYSIVLRDSADRESAPLSGNVIVDTSAPAVAISSVNGKSTGALINYLVQDNVSSQDISSQLSILSAGALIAGVPKVAPLAAGEQQIEWNGINVYSARALDGRYHFILAVTDEAGNSSIPQEGDIVLDGRPPTSSISFVGPSYEANGQSWIGSGTRLAMVAYDMAGTIDRIDYTLDASDWQRYLTPFAIDTAGSHTVSHRAVDLTGNAEGAKQRTISVDLEAPVSTLQVEGIQHIIDGKTHWSGSATFIKVAASDQGAGVGRSNFEIISPAVSYVASEQVTLGDIGDGEHAAKYWSVDKVANAEAKREVNFVLHGRPPELTFDIGLPKYRSSSATYVDQLTPLQVAASSPTDDIVYLEYRIDGGAGVTAVSSGTKQISSQAFHIDSEGSHTVRYFAVDDYENRMELALPLVVDNKPPLTTLEKSQEAAGEEYLATPSTLIRLNASDEIVGLKSTEYRMDAGPWQQYAKPFDLRSLSSGQHELFYHSKDLLDHVGSAHKQILELLMLQSGIAMSQMPRMLIFAVPDADRPDADSAALDDVAQMKELFNKEGWPLRIVHDPYEFLSSMRSDSFNFFAFASAASSYRFDGTEFVDKLFKELAARVYGGDAVVLLPSAAGLQGIAWDRLWGRVGGINAVELAAAARLLTPAGDDASIPTLVLNNGGKAFEGSIESIFREDDATVVGKKRYGRGSALLIGVPLGEWSAAFNAAPVNQDESLKDDPAGAWGAMWSRVMTSCVAAEELPSPGEVISYAITLTSSDRPAHATVTVKAPMNTALIDGEGGDSTQTTASWSSDIPPRETDSTPFTLRLPVDSGSADIPFTLVTSWLNGLTDVSTSTFTQKIGPSWRDQWSECLGALTELRDGKDLPDGAREMLSAQSDSWADAEKSDDIEKRISAALDSIEKLAVLDQTRVADLNGRLSRLVEALEIAASEGADLAAELGQNPLDSDGDGLSDDVEIAAGTDPFDADSDDDGVMDGKEMAALEDSDGDGLINALDPDSDNDGLNDGLELGVIAPVPDSDGDGPLKGTDVSVGNFIADSDPSTTTDMTKADTDGGGIADGVEDSNKNGRVDVGETDPNNAADDTNPVAFGGGSGGSGCSMVCAKSDNWFGPCIATIMALAAVLFTKKRTIRVIL